MTKLGWLTNDPETAEKLRAADRRYKHARDAAMALPLADKIEAYRAAKVRKDADYAAIRKGVNQ